MKVCMQRELLFIPVLILLLFSGRSLYAQKRLMIVTPGITPVSYESEGKISGFGTEIVNEVFRRLEIPIDISIVPSVRALAMLQTGQADVLYALAKTPERETIAVYTSEALIDQPISLFVLKESPITFDGDIKKLSKYRIGIIRGGRLSPDFDEALKNSMFPNIHEVNEYRNTILMLEAHRIDITIGPRYSILFAAKEANKLHLIRELAPVLTESSPAYIALSKKGKAADLHAQIDSILRSMKKDGSYDTIMQKYFK